MEDEVKVQVTADSDFVNSDSFSHCSSDEDVKEHTEASSSGFFEVCDAIDKFNESQLRRSQRPRKKKIIDEEEPLSEVESSDGDFNVSEKLKNLDLWRFNRSKKTEVYRVSSGLQFEETSDTEDAELTQFLRTGVFKKCYESSPKDLFDVKKVPGTTLNTTINDVIKKSWLDDGVKEVMKEVVNNVLSHNMSVKRAVKQYNLDWMELDSVLSAIYEVFGYDEYGFKSKEIRLPDTNVDFGGLIKPLRKKVPKKNVTSTPKKFMDFDGVEEVSKEAESKMFGNSKRKSVNNFSILGKQANGRKYARYGIYIPKHWKKHKEAIKAGICRSLEFHNYRSHKMAERKVKVEDKYLAIEDILLNGGSVKQNSVKYDINYSTLQNFSHRAIYVVSKVLGETAMLSSTIRRREEGWSWEEIFRESVKDAPSCCVRVFFDRH
ncbi:unnamed protein product [Bursaphelenchus okinawaensis]|uniref:Uncharacterized protein n=1 Tax=Bursaphelenchus okinawaensis TaxID=465554 RepID=A0A811L9V1_9BILA|nr:unnamed protein product [Bursaphelenchus okinawaensis]CAG9119516.1 unnamed protein product [Bursaphelenchus okinawaensis]